MLMIHALLDCRKGYLSSGTFISVEGNEDVFLLTCCHSLMANEYRRMRKHMKPEDLEVMLKDHCKEVTLEVYDSEHPRKAEKVQLDCEEPILCFDQV